MFFLNRIDPPWSPYFWAWLFVKDKNTHYRFFLNNTYILFKEVLLNSKVIFKTTIEEGGILASKSVYNC